MRGGKGEGKGINDGRVKSQHEREGERAALKQEGQRAEESHNPEEEQRLEDKPGLSRRRSVMAISW